MAAYTQAVASGKAPGNYSITFGPASRSGYVNSGTVSRTYAVQSNQLSLSVSPSATLAGKPGDIYSYTVTVTARSGERWVGTEGGTDNVRSLNTSLKSN